VSPSNVIALVPPTSHTVVLQEQVGYNLKDIPSKDLTNLGILVRLCVDGSPLETAAEQAVERQTDCMLAVGGAWDAYAAQAAPSQDLFARARAIYAYSVARLGAAGAAWLDGVLRGQLPSVRLGGPSPTPSASVPAGLASAKQLLASKAASVSPVAFLRALRDWRASHLAELLTTAVAGTAWDTGASGSQSHMSPGRFGSDAYQSTQKRFVVVSDSGMSLRNVTVDYPAGALTPPWALSGFLIGAWSQYRQSGSQADYDFALTVLRFSGAKSGGTWAGLPVETLDLIASMP
jgi:hypothetical protein